MDGRADRVLLVLPSLRLGGGERVMLQLARSFIAAGREVHVCALLSGGPLRSEIPASASLHELVEAGSATSGFALARRALPRLVALLRSINPGAVLSTMTGTNLLTALAHRRASRGARLVLREASSLVNTKSALKCLAMSRLYRRADVLVAVSAGVARDLRSLGLADEKIHIVHNPVDAGYLRELAVRGSPLPDADAIPYVIALGRVTAAKDYPNLLQAYALSALRSSHRLVIVGDGDQFERIKSLVPELGLSDRVWLPGAMDNPYRVLADAAMLVLSSRWEGYPNVLLEALALDVPIVATDCPHGPREILDGGRCGRLVPVGDPVALARAMDAEATHRSLGCANVLGAHDPQAIASRYLALLDGPLAEALS